MRKLELERYLSEMEEKEKPTMKDLTLYEDCIDYIVSTLTLELNKAMRERDEEKISEIKKELFMMIDFAISIKEMEK